jgi:hypothetical protein
MAARGPAPAGAVGFGAGAVAAVRSAFGATPLLWMMPAIALQSMLMVLEPSAAGLAAKGGMAGLSPLQGLLRGLPQESRQRRLLQMWLRPCP